MESVWSLFIIIVASYGNAITGTISSSNPILNRCDCHPRCTLHNSTVNDTLKVFRSTSDDNTIFCVSPGEMLLDIGPSSQPQAKSPSLYKDIEMTTFQPSTSTSNHKLFCLRVRVTKWHKFWSPLYVRCKMRDGHAESVIYDLEKGFPVSWKIKPTPKQSNNMLNDSTKSSSTPDSFIPSIPSSSINSTDNQTSMTETREGHVDRINIGPPALMDQTALIAVIGGGAAFMVLLVVLVVLLLRKVTRQQKALEMTNEEIDEFMLGVAAEKAQAKGLNGLFVLPYDIRLEIPKIDVTFRSGILGSGAFGQVVKGTYQGNQVAIKMLKNNASQNAEYLRSMLGELKVMSYVGNHPNLVALIGAITANIKGGEVYLIFEFCSNGNAHTYVRSHRDSFVDLLARPAPANPRGARRTTRFSMRSMVTRTRLSKFHGGASQSSSLTTKDFVRWAYEVASGMEYVSSKNVYHGDLAARNILLTQDLTAKVGDFGLSKQLDMEKYNCYVQKKECPLPLKWMAIESLRDLTFSIQSDVWSYGVTLWEIFTLGTTPYPGMDWNFESWKLLCEGKRLDKPELASDALYDAMKSCWDANPNSRPGFAQLRDLMYRELHKL